MVYTLHMHAHTHTSCLPASKYVMVCMIVARYAEPQKISSFPTSSNCFYPSHASMKAVIKIMQITSVPIVLVRRNKDV